MFDARAVIWRSCGPLWDLSMHPVIISKKAPHEAGEMDSAKHPNFKTHIYFLRVTKIPSSQKFYIANIQKVKISNLTY